MPILQRVVKPKTRRGKKALLHRAAKIVENTKATMFIRGANASQMVLQCMKDLYALKKPRAAFFSRKNDYRPFDDPTPVEFFSRKHDASLFVFGSHNKKRPHNMVIGRMFDHQMLDMVELGIDRYVGLNEFKTGKIAVGTKPCLLFAGEPFQAQYEHMRLKNLLIDFFRGEEVTGLRLEGVEHVLMFTAIEEKIYFRSYKIHLKRSSTSLPRTELEEIGPSIDLVVRRNRLASEDLFKTACKQPPQMKIKKTKNIKQDVFGTRLGRVHMPKQDVNKLQVRRMKGLRQTTNEMKQKRKMAKGSTGRPAKRAKRDNQKSS